MLIQSGGWWGSGWGGRSDRVRFGATRTCGWERTGRGGVSVAHGKMGP
ncbi:hypothetical protein EDD33_0771 [Nocardioides aurantiacus]|uniref:Uncharacterized protein n=1 Tax=Nocardioides aurantiacus TaxID=86796 RepID=A0A3N2CQY8_9ACTN|nr:hypothetical protein EDD33_0771 [Nocardioides aurantiacus]